MTNLDQFSPHYYLLSGCHEDLRVNRVCLLVEGRGSRKERKKKRKASWSIYNMLEILRTHACLMALHRMLWAGFQVKLNLLSQPNTSIQLHPILTQSVIYSRKFWDPRHITLDPRPSTLDPRPSTLDPRPKDRLGSTGSLQFILKLRCIFVDVNVNCDPESVLNDDRRWGRYTGPSTNQITTFSSCSIIGSCFDIIQI